MDIASRIRRMGFRKWYERQLIDSHLSFTTCFLSGIVVASCLEELGRLRLDLKSAALVALVVGAIALGLYSWRRYHAVLERAEAYGAHSTCPACRTYARFAVGPYFDPPFTPVPYPWLRVRCRQCGAVWRMPD